MKLKITLFVLFLLSFNSTIWAQKATLSGKITSEGAPVPGATVQIVNTSKGGVADNAGNYTISDLDAGSVTLKISSVGYADKTETLTLKSGANTLNVGISAGAEFLGEVVVTGLSINTKQKEQGTSRANISGETLKSLPAPTIENALVGRVAGVEAYSTDGAPGGGYRFRIRGGNSILGASEPLVIIDGVIMDNSNRNTTTGATGNTGAASFGMNNGTRGLANINPNDIESIEILKGAAAASLYGSRASAGVIVVKTKTGGKGKLMVSYGLDVGVASISRPIQNYKMDWSGADIDQWATFQNGRLAAASQITPTEIAQYKQNGLTDWSLEPFRKGMFQRHTLNIQGGNREFGYYVTLNSQNTEGHLKGTEFQSNGGRISLSSQPIDKLTIRVTGSYNKDFRTILPGGSPGFFIPNRWTVAGLQTPFMRLSDSRTAFIAGTSNIKSPDEYARINKRMDIERFQLSGNINYKITDNLSVDLNAGVDSSFVDGRTIYPVGVTSIFTVGRLDFDTESLTQKTLSTGINHLWQINEKLYLKSAIGTQYDENRRNYYYKRFQTYKDTLSKNELDTAVYSAPQNGSVLRFTPIVRTFGIYVNETFGIGKKLFVNLGGRFDRSTSFIEQFFFYPRASVSYQMKENMRFRAAYGSSGIQPPPYQINLTYQFEGAGYNGSAGGYRFSNPGNKDLRPEKQTEIEVGLDATFLNKRLNVELTYYNKSFSDMLFNASVAPDANNGFTRFIRNIATMYNRGFEFSVNANVLKTKDLDINVGFNGTTLENKITKLNDPAVSEFGGQLSAAQLGLDTAISSFSVFTPASPTKRVYIGGSIPKFEFGFNTSIAYKNFTFMALLGGKSGHYRFNTTERDLADPSIRMHKDYWSLPAADAKAKFDDLSQWIQKADFVKLRQLGLSYTYNRAAEAKGALKFVRSITVGVVGSNLYTWSAYKGGYDIEAETSGAGAGNAWVRGIDAWEAGPPKQWTLSFNVGF